MRPRAYVPRPIDRTTPPPVDRTRPGDPSTPPARLTVVSSTSPRVSPSPTCRRPTPIRAPCPRRTRRRRPPRTTRANAATADPSPAVWEWHPSTRPRGFPRRLRTTENRRARTPRPPREDALPLPERPRSESMSRGAGARVNDARRKPRWAVSRGFAAALTLNATMMMDQARVPVNMATHDHATAGGGEVGSVASTRGPAPRRARRRGRGRGGTGWEGRSTGDTRRRARRGRG